MRDFVFVAVILAASAFAFVFRRHVGGLEHDIDALWKLNWMPRDWYVRLTGVGALLMAIVAILMLIGMIMSRE